MSIKSKIIHGYNDAKILLNKTTIPFVENTIRWNNLLLDNYSKDFVDVCQNNDYPLVFHIARKKRDFNILLHDDSFFQFGYREKEGEIVNITYAYYEMPILLKSFSDFKNEYYQFYPEEGDMTKTTGELYEEYDQYKSEAQRKESFFPIRYDFDLDGYQGLRHPVSHIHIGHNTQMRIPLSTIIFPREFVAFVLRHVYYDDWVECIRDEEFKEMYKKIKETSEQLEVKLFDEVEMKDFHIS